jgi:hypothetical protein
VLSIIFYSASTRMFFILREIILVRYSLLCFLFYTYYHSIGLHSLSNITFSVQSIFDTCISGREPTAPGSGMDVFSLSAIKARTNILYLQLAHKCFSCSLIRFTLLLFFCFYVLSCSVTPVFIGTFVPLSPSEARTRCSANPGDGPL